MAKYKGRTVKLNKVQRGDVKKFKVFVRNRRTGRGSCGNCGLFSQKHMFCGVYRTKGVKDTYVCNKWRPRYIKR